jgi:microcystin-dependent protein
MMMKRLVAALGFLFGLAAIGHAENSGNIPPKFNIPWGNSAGGAYIRAIPQPSQIGIQNCAASLTDGFPPLSFTPAGNGGCPPLGQDFNGIFKQLSQWSRWNGMGTPVFYDGAFSGQIGGYPKWTVLSNASTPGCFWISQIESNTTNPDAGGANWLSMCATTGTTGTSTGSANSQTVSTAPFTTLSGLPVAGAQCMFRAGFTNTGPLRVNCNATGLINVFRRSQVGASLTVGGEVVVNQFITLVFDGTEWQCQSCQQAMIGQEIDFWGVLAQLPAGYLVEDGTCYTQASFPDLFSVVGTTYGSCSAGSFGVPDMRGTAGVALDNQGANGNAGRMSTCGNNTTLGGACGNQSQALSSTNQLPQFTPAGTISGTQSIVVEDFNGSGFVGWNAGANSYGNTTYTINFANAAFTGVAVGSLTPTSFAVVQPSRFQFKMIKY